MLRPMHFATAAALILAACGSSSSPAPSPMGPFAGAILGQPFTPNEATALVLSQEATCTYGDIAATATGIAFGFSTSTGLCDFITTNGACTNRANATTVSIVVVRANVSGGHPGPVQPGTYKLFTGTGFPDTDGQGNYVFFVADVTKTVDLSCTESPTPSAVSGTITINTIDTTDKMHVTGSASISFDGTTHVAGSFDVPTCSVPSLTVCTPLTCTTPAPCAS